MSFTLNSNSRFLRWSTVFLCVGMALPTATMAQTYECTLSAEGRGGFVSNKVFIRFENGGAQAMVIDNMINHVHGKPIAVRSKKISGGRYRLKWKLKNLELLDGPPTSIDQTLTLDTAKGTYQVNGYLRGYDNVISGGGTCKKS